ncbi:MAG: hypothetical protein QOI89_3410, partial [Solirubrobacteraceae bacterium]|nr:hypothetical protein [Solirubrobacteraceae bacterium]
MIDRVPKAGRGSVATDDVACDQVRVFISYAHDNSEHEYRVREFWIFLRSNGIDARLDVSAAERRQDWSLWALRQVRRARFVLVVASPAYRRRAEDEVPAGEGRGVQWEAAMIRQEVYADPEAALNRFLPVVLPGCSASDVPVWLGRETSTHYLVSEYTQAGAERLLNLLTGQVSVAVSPPGTPSVLPLRGKIAGKPRGLRSELLINASLEGAVLTVDVALAGTSLQVRRKSTFPHGVRTVRESLRAGLLVPAGWMPAVGRQLACAVFDERSQQLVADLLYRLSPGDWIDVVCVVDGTALDLPVELLRLTTASGEDLGPLAL